MEAQAQVCSTERLAVRRIDHDDAAFLIRLYNEPAFLRFIGDKNVRTLDDAHAHIEAVPLASYARHGFGMYLVERLEDGASIGICGLLKRDTLPDIDLGFAYAPEFRRSGYAVEAGRAMLDHARHDFGIRRIVGITTPDNIGSMTVLERLGFAFERMCALTPDAPELRLFGRAL